MAGARRVVKNLRAIRKGRKTRAKVVTGRVRQAAGVRRR